MKEFEDKNAGKIELSDEVLDQVTGGRAVLFSMPEDYLCFCTLCGRDTTWQASDDGLRVFCSVCGTEKDRLWYDNNKIRKKGV